MTQARLAMAAPGDCGRVGYRLDRTRATDQPIDPMISNNEVKDAQDKSQNGPKVDKGFP